MFEINGETKQLAIIGNPVSHSFSPQMHNYISEKMGLNYVYTALKVEENGFDAAIEGIRSMGFAGVNITAPYKIRAYEKMDVLSERAKRFGSVNTCVNKNGVLHGYNTDAEGFYRSLIREGIEVKDRDVLFVGAGGFTRGMIEALKDPAFTHVILMDDDIILNPDVLRKTGYFLSAVKKEWQDAPLGGALIERDIPWKQFECGAFWNRGKIQGCGQNLDLRRKDSLLKNTEVQNWEYGGWWYCAIPVSAIREKGLPLPLFIHRDDIEYGIRLGKLMTLNGIGVWHEAVIKKLPQMGEYYDIRNMAIVNAIHYDDWDSLQWKKFLTKWVAGNLLRGRYSYIYLNICAMMDFLKGEKWLEKTDGVEIHAKVAARVPKLEKMGHTEKNVFYTTPDVSVYTAAKKKHIVYEDSAGFCLKADKNLPEAIRLSIYLLLALRKTDRYFEKSRESYSRNWKKLITEEFWNKYLEIDKNE